MRLGLNDVAAPVSTGDGAGTAPSTEGGSGRARINGSRTSDGESPRFIGSGSMTRPSISSRGPASGRTAVTDAGSLTVGRSYPLASISAPSAPQAMTPKENRSLLHA